MIRCNLAVILAEQNLKAIKVSADTGISRTTLTSLSNNRSQGIQLDTMNTLCLYLKVTPDKLFSFCPIDINIIDVKENLGDENKPVYFIDLSFYEHKQYSKLTVFGTLEEIPHVKESYIFKIDFANHWFGNPEYSNAEYNLLDKCLKQLPKVFLNDLENIIIEKAIPTMDKDSIVVEWNLESKSF